MKTIAVKYIAHVSATLNVEVPDDASYDDIEDSAWKIVSDDIYPLSVFDITPAVTYCEFGNESLEFDNDEEV